MVGTRTIRATLPGADLDALAGLPGVSGAERRGEAVVLSCADSDAAIRALLAAYPDARDIEIAAAGLEEAFLQLTGADTDIPEPAGAAPSAAGAFGESGCEREAVSWSPPAAGLASQERRAVRCGSR